MSKNITLTITDVNASDFPDLLVIIDIMTYQIDQERTSNYEIFKAATKFMQIMSENEVEFDDADSSTMQAQVEFVKAAKILLNKIEKSLFIKLPPTVVEE